MRAGAADSAAVPAAQHPSHRTNAAHAPTKDAHKEEQDDDDGQDECLSQLTREHVALGQGRGDLGITFLVQTPTRLDHEQRELLRQLASLRDETTVSGSVQSASKGFFGRVKEAFGG